jgi:hypothetical protein
MRDMTIVSLVEIPFRPQKEILLESVRLDENSQDAAVFLTLLEQAEKVARPKAVYRESYVEDRTESSVTIDGVTFESRTLRLNLDKTDRVFPYVATCGIELDALPLPDDDFLARFWLDMIKDSALHASYQYLVSLLESRYALKRSASMNPGSGDVSIWPIEQQEKLFSLLGDVKEAVGVTLTESYLMVPNKTTSGVIFPTERAIQTCQVCRRENCPSRRASFNPYAWEAVQPAQNSE